MTDDRYEERGTRREEKQELQQALVVACAEDMRRVLHLEGVPFYQKLEAIDAFLASLPSALTEPVHRFAPGLYCRELPMPAGIVWLSRIHLQEHIAIISKGRVSVVTEHGTEQLQAPCTMVTQPGTQRLIYTHEDTIWTTVHATPLTEADGIEAIEDALTCRTYHDYRERIGEEGAPCLSE